MATCPRLLTTFALAAALSLVSCGRTQPLSSVGAEVGVPPTPPGVGSQTGQPAAPTFEPLLVDLDLGLLTARTIDGRVMFSQRVSPAARHGRLAERLISGKGQVGRVHLHPGSSTQVLGLVRPDGLTAFESDPSAVDFFEAWLTPGGVVARSTQGGFWVDRGAARRFSFQPVAGLLSSGLVAAFDEARALHWVDPKIGTALRTIPLTDFLQATLVGDALYATARQSVIESTPSGDTIVAAPFSFPQLLAANGARQVLISDPTRSRLAVVDFAGGQTSEVSLNDPALASLGTLVDRAIDLDDAGNVYATFIGTSSLEVLRTSDLGSRWTSVGRVPITQRVDVVRLARGGGGVLVSGGRARSSEITEWSFAAWFGADGTATELPIDGVATLNAKVPVTLSADGKRVAFWAPEQGTTRLCVLDTASAQTTVLERRTISLGGGLALYPALAWLE